jgi:ATP/maltotriose-dependent transcriptional regulator MalT
MAWLERALGLLGSNRIDEWAHLQRWRGLFAIKLGDAAAAELALSSSATYWEDKDSPHELGRALIGLGQLHLDNGELDAAETLLLRVEELAVRADSSHLRLVTAGNLATIAERRGNLPEAAERYAGLVKDAQAAGDTANVAWALSNLGHCQLALERNEEAWASLVRSLRALDELSWAEGVVYTLAYLAAVALARGDPHDALLLLTAADELGTNIDLTWQTSEVTYRANLRADLAAAFNCSVDDLAPIAGVDPDAVVQEVLGRATD